MEKLNELFSLMRENGFKSLSFTRLNSENILFKVQHEDGTWEEEILKATLEDEENADSGV